MSWSDPSAAQFSAFWPAAAMRPAALCLGCCGPRVSCHHGVTTRTSGPLSSEHSLRLKKDSSSLFVSRKKALSPFLDLCICFMCPLPSTSLPVGKIKLFKGNWSPSAEFRVRSILSHPYYPKYEILILPRKNPMFLLLKGRERCWEKSSKEPQTCMSSLLSHRCVVVHRPRFLQFENSFTALTPGDPSTG